MKMEKKERQTFERPLVHPIDTVMVQWKFTQRQTGLSQSSRQYTGTYNGPGLLWFTLLDVIQTIMEFEDVFFAHSGCFFFRIFTYCSLCPNRPQLAWT